MNKSESTTAKKLLLLLRHAKSSWKDASLRDFDRPLNDRGTKAAAVIGKFMRDRRLRPDILICSPAERARQTAALVMEAAGITAPLTYDKRIYEANVSQLLDVIGDIESDKREVMLIGHNPGFENLLSHLTGTSEHMPTASFARIILEVKKWQDVPGEKGKLDWFVKPRDLG